MEHLINETTTLNMRNVELAAWVVLYRGLDPDVDNNYARSVAYYNLLVNRVGHDTATYFIEQAIAFLK